MYNKILVYDNYDYETLLGLYLLPLEYDEKEFKNRTDEIQMKYAGMGIPFINEKIQEEFNDCEYINLENLLKIYI